MDRLEADKLREEITILREREAFYSGMQQDMSNKQNHIATLEAELAEANEKAEHREETCHAQWKTSSTIEADNNTLSKENAALTAERDRLLDITMMMNSYMNRKAYIGLTHKNHTVLEDFIIDYPYMADVFIDLAKQALKQEK